MVQEQSPKTGQTLTLAVGVQKTITYVGRHWLALVNLFCGVLFGLPWLAPIMMKVGASGPARVIYLVYSFLCHQLADRSFFLFGPKWMYSSADLLPYAPAADTWLGLRAFVGLPALGYKVAWSDRMVALYGGLFLGGLMFALLRCWLHAPRWRTVALMTLPMVVDGATHWASDLVGLGRGFRDSNAWLATLTANLLPQAFYLGNSLGSFNSWMRLTTGLFFGLAVAWAVYPRLEEVVNEQARMRSAHATLVRPGQESIA
jgi:uncharacterized membrane protein